ncbi:MAG: TonB-dependent siderophore receptor [Pseudomonadota bacterium]
MLFIAFCGNVQAQTATTAPASGADEKTLPAVRVSATPELDAATQGTASYTTRAVTLGKTPQALRDIPQSVSVLTRQRIEDQNFTQLETALDQMTGLQLDASTGIGSANLYSRGFLINNYQFDGVPQIFLGTSFTGSDLAVYDRVEVLRGAAGLLQGSGNPSATVNLVRKKPTQKFAASATASAGTWNFARGEVDVGGPLNGTGTVRGRVVAVQENRDYFVDVTNSKKSVFYGVLDVDLGPATALSLGVQRQRVYAIPFIFGLPRYADGRSLNLPRSTMLVPAWNRWSQNIDEVFLNLDHYLDNTWKLNLAFNTAPQEQDFKRSITRGTGTAFGVNPANPAASIYTGVRWQSEGDRRNLDASASGPVLAWGRKHEVVVGVNANDYVSNTRSSAFLPAVAIPNVFAFNPYSVAEPNEGPFTAGTTLRTRQYGLYGSARLEVTDPLTLILGARLSGYTTQTNNHNLLTSVTTVGREVSYQRQLTPYAGLVVALDRQHSVYTSYTDIFTPQTVQFNAAGVELDPIVGSNYEVGVKGAYAGGAVNTSAALFRIDQTNRAQEDIANPCATARIANACYVAEGAVRSQGFEAEVSGRVLPDLDISAGYTFNETSYLQDRTNQGQPLRAQTPRHLLKLWAQYRPPVDGQRWTLGAGVNAQSAYYAMNGAVRSEQDAIAIVNLRVGYQVSKQIGASLAINNLLDTTYYASIRGVDFGNLYGDPRNLMLTLRASY